MDTADGIIVAVAVLDDRVWAPVASSVVGSVANSVGWDAWATDFDSLAAWESSVG